MVKTIPFIFHHIICNHLQDITALNRYVIELDTFSSLTKSFLMSFIFNMYLFIRLPTKGRYINCLLRLTFTQHGRLGAGIPFPPLQLEL